MALSTICLASFDLPSHSSSGYLLRYISPRAGPITLYAHLARNPFFSKFAPGSDFVLGTGHGDSDSYSAQAEDIIWKAGQYDKRQTEGKVIYLLSCDTGLELGPDLIDYGQARAFRGFTGDFLWIVQPGNWIAPYTDPHAGQILMPVVNGLNSLMDGATISEAMDIEKNSYMKSMEDTNNELLFSLLKWNYDHSILLGDPNATIKPRPKITLPIPPPPLIF